MADGTSGSRNEPLRGRAAITDATIEVLIKRFLGTSALDLDTLATHKHINDIQFAFRAAER